MFRKFTALLMITSFTHAFAMSPIMETSAMADALSRTFDEMNYSLNVEWDQKDQQFFKTTVDSFEKEIQSLQDQGLTNKELVEFTLAKIKDKQTQKDLEEISNLIVDSQMTSDEARDFALEKLNSTYSQGTSWSGHRHGLKMVVILGILIIILCAKNKDDDRKPDHNERPDRPNCRDDWHMDSVTHGGGQGGWDGCNQFAYPGQH